MGKSCAICGKPSGLYPLCTECFKLRDAGTVVKCEKCNMWHKSDMPCKCTEKPTEIPRTVEKAKEADANRTAPAPSFNKDTEKPKEVQTKGTEKKCAICEAASNGKDLCLECYREIMAKQDEIDKNQKPFELKDYYFNLKSNIYRMQNFGYVKGNIKKLFSIAWIARDVYRDSALADRVAGDAAELVEAKKPKQEEPKPVSANVSARDTQKAALIRTNDGHVVKSMGEKVIDNILYSSGICHAYEKDVIEIPANERTVKSDFYIPVSNGRGIYIEYWGMDSDDYQDNKKEKQKLYEQYDAVLIDIEKGDTDDEAGLLVRINREYRAKAKEKFKITIS